MQAFDIMLKSVYRLASYFFGSSLGSWKLSVANHANHCLNMQQRITASCSKLVLYCLFLSLPSIFPMEKRSHLWISESSRTERSDQQFIYIILGVKKFNHHEVMQKTNRVHEYIVAINDKMKSLSFWSICNNNCYHATEEKKNSDKIFTIIYIINNMIMVLLPIYVYVCLFVYLLLHRYSYHKK